ncbi:MAG TPA: hypothetical protein VJ021_05160 [Thermoplasmata archaeon]|nr:hypothetical protein [Thermoplasmata archaeon]
MSSSGDRNLGFLFGALGAVILIVAGVINFFGGFVFLALGLGGPALGALTRSVIYVVFGIIIGLFTLIGRSGGNDRTFTAGVVLIVLAVVGWFGLGLANGLLALLAALFALIAGILYLLSAR